MKKYSLHVSSPKLSCQTSFYPSFLVMCLSTNSPDVSDNLAEYFVRSCAPVGQLEESAGLSPVQCGFESHRGHHFSF